MSKTDRIDRPETLLNAFANSLENLDVSNVTIRVIVLPSGSAELHLKVRHQKQHFPIRARLHPSRELILRRASETAEKPFVLLCPHIPAPLASDLRREQINHADLNGRLFIQTPWILLDREPKERLYGNPTAEPDLFSPKASRIVRCLLADRDRDWEQEQLVERTKVSPGLVSRILKTLTRNGYVAREGDANRRSALKYRLKEFDRLLDDWRVEDAWHKRVRVQQYSLLSDDVIGIARIARDALGEGNVCFTQWFAAHLRHPYTTPPLVSAYLKKPGSPDIQFARRVDTGGNLWLLSPQDEGIFFETQEVSGFNLVVDVQIYLDLLQVGQRGPDQADALRRWEGFAQ